MTVTTWNIHDKSIRMIANGHKAQGTIILKNDGTEVLKLRHIPVEKTSLRTINGQPLSQVQVSKRIKPGEEITAKIRIDIDPTMPPGEYEGLLKYDSVIDETFIVSIPEKTKVTLHPHTITREGTAGEKVDINILIENLGNVPVTIDKTKSMLLAEEQEVFKTFGSAVRKFSSDGHTKVLDALTDNLKNIAVRPMLVKFTQNDCTINPGEVRAYTVQMKLPYSLRKNRYYYGNVFVGGVKFDTTIHCTGTAE